MASADATIETVIDLLQQVLARLPEAGERIRDRQQSTEAKYLTIKGAAARSGLSVSAIRNLLAAGKLTARRATLGKGRITIAIDELDRHCAAPPVQMRRGRGIRPNQSARTR
jgi:hypothetical protein